jgi:hypothetical protein
MMKAATQQFITSTLRGLALLLIALPLLAWPAYAQSAHSADAFVDSVGLNIHLHDGDTPYGDFPAVEKALRALGVRHVRDGLIDTQWMPYYDRINALGRDGIKCIFITNPNQTVELLQSYPDRMKDSFEGYEAPNEYDNSNDKDWVATLTHFLPTLAQAVRTNPANPAFPIMGPSFVHAESYSLFPEASQYFDFSNLHNYFAGRNPGTSGWGADGYGSLAWDIDLVTRAWPSLPIVTTETGYQTDTTNPQGIPESVAAKYLPRLLLEQYAHGIRRTYLYELVDVSIPQQGIHNTFGLVRSDFSPKPAFLSIQHLISLLADPGVSFTPRTLPFTVSGELSNVHYLLFEKRDGTYLIAIWQEVPSYDVNSKQMLPVSPQHVIVALPSVFNIQQHRLNEDGSVTVENIGMTSHAVISVDDRVTLLKLTTSSTLQQTARSK